jgi:hypothetical protein
MHMNIYMFIIKFIFMFRYMDTSYMLMFKSLVMNKPL